ncbi:hypothetical protein H4I96_01970, partial [Botrytis cinerea]
NRHRIAIAIAINCNYKNNSKSSFKIFTPITIPTIISPPKTIKKHNAPQTLPPQSSPSEIFINFQSHNHDLDNLVLHYRNAIDSASFLSILHSTLAEVARRMEEILRLKTLLMRCHFDGRLRLRGKYKRLINKMRGIQTDLLGCLYCYDGN